MKCFLRRYYPHQVPAKAAQKAAQAQGLSSKLLSALEIFRFSQMEIAGTCNFQAGNSQSEFQEVQVCPANLNFCTPYFIFRSYFSIKEEFVNLAFEKK